MFTKQISVFLENQKGRLAEVTKLLTDEGINIRALCLADTSDFGVLRLIVDDRAKCLRVLKGHELAAQETDVLAVEIDDHPGALHAVLRALDQEDVNVEYMYTMYEKKGDHVIVVFRSDAAPRAVEACRKHGISMLPEDAIQKL